LKERDRLLNSCGFDLNQSQFEELIQAIANQPEPHKIRPSDKNVMRDSIKTKTTQKHNP